MRCCRAAKANRILQHSFRPVPKLSVPFLPRRSVQTSTAGSSPSQQQIIFSGIQPTGIPHLGNYLGALREWVRLQNESTGDRKLIFSVVDLHALTVPQEASQLRQWRREIYAMLLAIGLDPKRSTLFFQSAVRTLDFLLGEHYATRFFFSNTSTGFGAYRTDVDFEYSSFYGLSFPYDSMESMFFLSHSYIDKTSTCLFVLATDLLSRVNYSCQRTLV